MTSNPKKHEKKVSEPSISERPVSVPARPEILNNSKIKLFVLLLCAISFYAGWKASRSYLVKECQLAGAQVVTQDSLVFCKMPD